MNIGQKLIELKQRIESADREYEQAVGRLKELKRQLKDEYGCSSVEEAEKKFDELEETIDKMKKELEVNLEKLGEKYDI